jgi:ABC-type lipoprotein release transport system permease subunit
MKFLISLAWKNLSRYRRRTLITAAAIAVGLGIFIFLDGFLLGVDSESERNLKLFETGSAQVQHEEYFAERENYPLDYVVEAPEELLRELDEMGIPATGRTQFSGEFIVTRDPYAEDGSLFGVVTAIDPETDGRVFDFRGTVVEGRYLEPNADEVMLGAWLAESLGAEIGYPITIATRTRTGYYQTIRAEIVGIVDCPSPQVNRSTAFIPLETADYYLEMDGAVTSVALSFSDLTDARERAEEVEEHLGLSGDTERAAAGVYGPLDILPWQELAADYVAISQMKRSGSGVILFLIVIIAAVGITNTMLMAVYERIRELGMMRAMGMGDREVRLTFLLEAGGIGFIGSVLGTIFGIGLNAFMVYRGLDFTWILKDMDLGYRVSGVMHGAWHPSAIVGAFFLGIALSVLIAFIPTRRALKLEITDCLRHQ